MRTIPFRPRLTVNRAFMEEFVNAKAPCLALGLVEEQDRQCGFLALRPDEVIPPEVLGVGLNFGHSLLGDATMEVIHFAFEFYGFKIYNVLINPNNRVVQTVLAAMIEGGDYFFFALDSDSRVTAFRADIGQDALRGLKANMSRIRNSTTADGQYRAALARFKKNPYPQGTLLNWVCRDNLEYLDLSTDRLDLTPR